MNAELNISNNNIKIKLSSEQCNYIIVQKDIDKNFFSFQTYNSYYIYAYDENTDILLEELKKLIDTNQDFHNPDLKIKFISYTGNEFLLIQTKEFENDVEIFLGTQEIEILIYLINILKKIIDNKPFKEVIE